jgi:methyltransferase
MILNDKALILIILVALARIVEIGIGEFNARRMLREGGKEYAPWQRPPIFIIYGLWLVSLAVLTPKNAVPHEAMLWVFCLLEVTRWWAIAHLGKYWTTRIIVIPLTFRITTGPYRFMKHPIYIVLLGEVMALSLTFNQWGVGCFFSVWCWAGWSIASARKPA